MTAMNRKEFILASAAGMLGLLACRIPVLAEDKKKKEIVALIKTSDRKQGVIQALGLLNFAEMKNKRVFIKPNFNTADPAPGSTHNDVLETLVHEIKKREAISVTVGDHCGPGVTKKVMEDKGIFELGKKLGFGIINFDELDEKEWVLINPENSHWKKGFHLAKPLVDSEYTVTTGCLKTHGFGGHYSLSMKLSVGAVHRKHLMSEMHASPDIRKMIAEINLGYKPQLIVMDGVEVFTDGGPMRGVRKAANVIIAGTDRVAVDAVGLAVLKEIGSNSIIMNRKIFEQEQMKRAVEIGLGVSGPEQIEIVTDNSAGKAYAEKLSTILNAG